MAYGSFKDLSRRTASEKILRDKTFSIVKNLKYDGYQCELASMFYNFFDKKSASHTKRRINSNSDSENQKCAEILHKPIIRKFEKYNVYSSFQVMI